MDQNKTCLATFNDAHHNGPSSPSRQEQNQFQTFWCNTRSQLDKHDVHISTLWRWLNADNFINENKRVIWDPQDADYVHCGLLECDTKYCGKSWLIFQRIVLPLSSEERTMMINRARTPDVSVHCYQTAWCHIPKHSTLYNWPQKNSHTFHLYQTIYTAGETRIREVWKLRIFHVHRPKFF